MKATFKPKDPSEYQVAFVFGKEFTAGKAVDVSDLKPAYITKLKGNPHFEVAEVVRREGDDGAISAEEKKTRAAALLARGDSMHHSTFAAEARKLLGDDSLDKKDEAVEALKKAAA